MVRDSASGMGYGTTLRLSGPDKSFGKLAIWGLTTLSPLFFFSLLSFFFFFFSFPLHIFPLACRVTAWKVGRGGGEGSKESRLEVRAQTTSNIVPAGYQKQGDSENASACMQ